MGAIRPRDEGGWRSGGGGGGVVVWGGATANVKIVCGETTKQAKKNRIRRDTERKWE